ncbi:MAG: transposase [Flavobacteriales bacterium]|nr:transposase [Flavobacteriales bacterium]
MSKKTSFKQVRFFSLDLKKYIVKEIESGQFSIIQASREYGVSQQTVYNWLYQYSKNLKKGTRVVVEQDSVDKSVEELKRQVKELQAALGRKSLQADLYEIMIDLASKEFGTDLKKNFGDQALMNSSKKR